MVDASNMLLSKYSVHLSSPDEQCVQILKSALELVLLVISKFEQHYPDSKSHKRTDSIKKAMSDVDKALRNWVDKDQVIGKKMFGGLVTTRLGQKRLQKEAQEIKVYTHCV